MRILKLHFKNIHSLSGEHVIDFTSPPLKDAGLFLISGPTGAGKSTILDVITIALFNRLPRFTIGGKESLSKNEIEKLGSVISHHTDSAFASVTYRTHLGEYTSTWSIRKSKKGKLQDYEMGILDKKSDKILDLKKSEVPEKNADLIGLSYDQFVKAILLSQGEFAKFLKSAENERAKLLEDITETSIFRLIGQKAFEKARAKEVELNEMSLQLAEINVLSDEAINKIKQDIEDLNTEILNKTTKIEQAQDYVKLCDNIEKDLRTLKENKGKLIDINQNIITLQPLFNKLKRHNKIAIHRQGIQEWIDIKEKTNNLSQQLKVYDLEILKLEQAIKEAISNLSLWLGHLCNEEEFSAALQKLSSSINELLEEKRMIEREGKHVRGMINYLLQNIKEKNNNLKNISEPQVLLSETRTIIAHLNPDIKTQSEYETLISKREQSKIELESLRNKVVLIDKITEKLQIDEDWNKKLKEVNDKISESRLKIKKLEQEIDSESIIFEDIKKKQLQESIYQQLESLRDNLSEGDPCPLCGAIHHNVSVVSQDHKDQTAIKKYEEMLTILRQLEDQKANELNSLNSYMNFKQIYEDEITKNAINIEGIKHDLQLTDDEIPLFKIRLEKEDASYRLLDQSITDFEYKNHLEEIMKKAEELCGFTHRYIKIAEQLKKYGDTEKFVESMNVLQKTFHQNQANKKQYQNNKISTTQEIAQCNNRFVVLENKLLVAFQKLGYTDVQNAANDLLNDEEYARITTREEQLLADQRAFQNQITSIQEAIILQEKAKSMHIAKDIDTVSLSSMINERDQLLINKGGLQNDLQTAENNIRIHKERSELLERKRKLAIPYLHVSNLIGDRDGNKYAKYAQNLSLHHLIYLTNLRLQKLTDRYLLEFTQIDQDLSISDLYQGGALRSVKTLSGGETFIVSLALALSLADMAARHIRLESLFIDEGFGTLDPDTLEVAIATLEKLQTETDRTIGIISHVETLKERIATQIHVTKSGLGSSRIKIIAS